jgi:DNA gyrase/topoisomerase IV subunit B
VTQTDVTLDLDLAATVVRACVLYSLMEFQSGSATTIKVAKHGSAFSVSDDGRGHPLDKMLEGTPYTAFVYTHFDYPFESARAAPIQLQGIGMSLVNAMCGELLLTVRKQSETLTILFKDGQFRESNRCASERQETGVTVQAVLRQGLTAGEANDRQLESWLQGIVQVHPALQLFFNGELLQARDRSPGGLDG